MYLDRHNRNHTSFRRSVRFTAAQCALLLFVSIIGAREASAQNLRSSADYAEEENERALKGIIDQAQAALEAIQDPAAYSDERMQRNRRAAGQPRIVNGRGTIDYPASGAVLKGEDPRTATAWCSGNLIAPNKFLTAAHCLARDPRPRLYHVYLHSAGIFAVAAVEWQKDLYKFPTADVAVLTLVAPVERITPEAILTEDRPLHGTLGAIVGFGRSGGFNYDYGIKREGFVETAACPSSLAASPLICWNFDAEVTGGGMRSNTCNADSGGGLFVEEVVGSRRVRRIAGVTSGGELDDCLIGDRSYNADVVTYADWITQTAQLNGEPKAAGPAPALSPQEDVLGETFTLHSQRARVDVPIDVRDGTSALMVAMNGDDNGEGRNNFDLQVSRDAASVCTEDGDGQFAFCRFDNPAPGAWTVTVTRQRGQGLAQVVVTQYRAIEQ
ncbi:trypsin-like serine protease [Paracoccus actinidiae]|uniref:trypsin-like serine protease n=1 Tax=Paracoccus actinidiae TaxID=3064531 RepID=UPI0027D2B5F0|nr:trypsin-like serine protease [Paracoccus sp. M09]